METVKIPVQEWTSLQEDIAHLRLQLEQSRQSLDWFKRQLFGEKSERFIAQHPDQQELFVSPKTDEANVITEKVQTHSRRRKQKITNQTHDTGLRFDEDVPRNIIDILPDALQGDDAGLYEIVSYKETHRLAQQVGAYRIITYRRPVYRLKPTATKESQTDGDINTSLITTPAPENVLDGCYADVSLLAGMMVDKGVYHLPLHRQHQRLVDSGIMVSRATLLNWMSQSIELLKPIYQALYDDIFRSRLLAIDEVPMKVGLKSKGKMNQSYFWPIFGENDQVIFTWSPSRGEQHAYQHLKNFNGALITDGYQAYTRVLNRINVNETRIVHAQCWAHSRRYFEKAQKMEPELAAQALRIIQSLYKQESIIRDLALEGDDKKSHRQKHAKPIVDEFFKWTKEQREKPELLPSNPLSKALQYVMARETELQVFLEQPDVPLDTNHLERALRVIPMGRKNYLFCWKELGAKHMAILQSLLVTCKLHQINPYHYLLDVLQRISIQPASKVHDLIPRIWKEKFAEERLKSDIEKDS